MNPSQMSAQERASRSRLAQIVSRQPLLRGSLTLRKLTCGKPNCRCRKGHKHEALYLSYSKDGKPRQLFVPKRLEPAVRQWVGNYHTVRGLLEQISEATCERIKTQKG